jgi:hypothetical protein
MSDLAELVSELARVRAEYHRLQLEEVEAQNKLLDLPEYQAVVDATETKKAAMETERLAADAVREAALASGERQPHPAVQVKAYEVLDCYDSLAILQHYRHHLPETIKLDTKALAKVVKAGVQVPGAQMLLEHRATIASDLTPYLGEGDADYSGV